MSTLLHEAAEFEQDRVAELLPVPVGEVRFYGF
jgi:hypothetical protein